MDILMQALGLIAFTFGIALWRGYVLTILWAWFVVPFGVIPIGIAWATGLAFLTYMMLPSGAVTDGGERKITGEVAGRAIAVPFFGLTFGWIAHQFM